MQKRVCIMCMYCTTRGLTCDRATAPLTSIGGRPPEDPAAFIYH